MKNWRYEGTPERAQIASIAPRTPVLQSWRMALELNKLTKDVEALGQNLAERLAVLAEQLPVAQAALHSIGVADEALRRKVELARQYRWAGAIPTSEAVDEAFALPPVLARYNVIAADGSQVYPDRHGVALYYLINIGSIVFRCGLSLAPSTSSQPKVFYQDEDLYEDEGGQKPKVKIDAQRDRAELAELARLAGAEAAHAPTVALLDNGLLLYLSLQVEDQALIRELLNRYIDELDRLEASGAAVAGVVDRPRAASVVRLLHLNSLPLEQITDEALRRLGAWERLMDGALFEFLQPGERSALFVHASPANEIYYAPRGHTLYFFYVNAGRPGKPALLRVEVPEWVARDRERLNWVHLALVEQSLVSDGFPYVLMRAHELAVVTMSERRSFDEMVVGALIKQKLRPSISQKAQGKAWTGAARRRYP